MTSIIVKFVVVSAQYFLTKFTASIKMSVTIPECPPSLKSIQHYLKTAAEHDTRDPVVAYWCRLHALQVGLKIATKKTPEETKLLMCMISFFQI